MSETRDARAVLDELMEWFRPDRENPDYGAEAFAMDILNGWRDELAVAHGDRARTIADEAFGPFPVQTAEDALTAIERGIFKLRQELAAAREASAPGTAASSRTCIAHEGSCEAADCFAASVGGFVTHVKPAETPVGATCGAVSHEPAELERELLEAAADADHGAFKAKRDGLPTLLAEYLRRAARLRARTARVAEWTRRQGLSREETCVMASLTGPLDTIAAPAKDRSPCPVCRRPTGGCCTQIDTSAAPGEGRRLSCQCTNAITTASGATYCEGCGGFAGPTKETER